MKNLIDFCKEFRMNVLKLSLQDVEDLTGTPSKTLSSFENGRSTNIKHLNIYYSLCKNQDERDSFVQGFDNAMDKDNDHA